MTTLTNTVRHDQIDKSEYVIHNWPTPLVISQHGESVHTGAKLVETPDGNPVREAYYRRFGGQYKGRSSWDQLAVLYGVRGLEDYFTEVTEGKGRLSNGYEMGDEARFFGLIWIRGYRIVNLSISLKSLMIKTTEKVISTRQ